MDKKFKKIAIVVIGLDEAAERQTNDHIEADIEIGVKESTIPYREEVLKVTVLG